MDRLSDYEYELPPELIAQAPLADRAASRLLVLDKSTGRVDHRSFRDFPSLLKVGDVLVLNETRVTARRLHGRREDTEGAVELLVLNRTSTGSFECLAKPAKRLRVGIKLAFENSLLGVVTGVGTEGVRHIQFNDPELIERQGETPLPPYITSALSDPERYQTVYSALVGEGSAAAPTAGLHFTPEMLEEITDLGIQIARVCLDVGIDTFRPVQVGDLTDHQMHGESCSIPSEAAKIILEAQGRVVAVGTTTARTLETFARLPEFEGTTLSRLFLKPGSDFKVVNAMLTNFHLPRTTMLMMLSALAGRENIMEAYAEAVAERYRFLSFGDAMFIA